MSYLTLMIAIWIGMGAVFGFVIWWLLQFKHQFRVFEKTGTKRIIHNFKFKEVVAKNGDNFFEMNRKSKFFPHKQRFISPESVPPDCIFLTNKGKFVINALWGEKAGFQFLTMPTFQPIENKALPYDILTSNQKSIYLRQLRLAEEWRSKNALADILNKYLPLGMAVMVVVALIIFYGDMAKPLLEMGDKLIQMQESQNKMMKVFESVIQDKQWIDPMNQVIRQDGNLTISEVPG